MPSPQTGQPRGTDLPDVTEFARSPDTLRVYQQGELIFSSQQERLLPLLDYLATLPLRLGVTVLDRVTGNAAALLAVRARAARVYGLVGSRHAAQTLTAYGVTCEFGTVVSEVRRADGSRCPMETLSLGQTPDAFYAALRERQAALKGQA